MYDAYDTDSDYAYEDFRESTGHITNFPASQEPIFLAAIAEYKKIKPSAILTVKEGSYPGSRGFYASGDYGSGEYSDLGQFWAIFDRIEAENK